jgi:hypothetical protein
MGTVTGTVDAAIVCFAVIRCSRMVWCRSQKSQQIQGCIEIDLVCRKVYKAFSTQAWVMMTAPCTHMREGRFISCDGPHWNITTLRHNGTH